MLVEDEQTAIAENSQVGLDVTCLVSSKDDLGGGQLNYSVQQNDIDQLFVLSCSLKSCRQLPYIQPVILKKHQNIGRVKDSS